jgi:hypothetical protein
LYANWSKMTDEQQKILTNFETRVRQLMLLCESLKQEKQELQDSLESRNMALRKSEETIRDLTNKYDNLKLASMVSFGKSDVKGARQRLSGLVREIDRCIALINE